MKRRLLTFGLAALCVGADAVPSHATAAAPRHSYVVVYESGTHQSFPVQSETRARERAYGFHSEHRFRHALDGFSARLTDTDVRALRADPDVALVARDRMLHAARVPLVAGDTVPTGVARIAAANEAGVHAPSKVAVAVLDTGIDLSHPDLNVQAGPNCTGAGPPADDEGHGTFVAGVIGARNDGSGVAGVAPGTEVWAVKVLGPTGDGLVSDIICGIDWVTANAGGLGIRVANMSLSGPFQAAALHMAIQRSVGAGIVYTAAAGNDGADLADAVPGSYPEVLTATAMADSDGVPGGTGPPLCDTTESDDRYGSFSNFATRSADVAHTVAAPGVCIESTAPGGGPQTVTGTSAAAPHVAGVVALCMGEAGRPGPCADMTPAEVTEQVRADAAVNATPQNGFFGDPFAPVGVYFGNLVSAADPTVRRIPPRPAPAPAAPAAPASQLDTTLDVIDIRIAHRQDVDRLSAVVRLAEPATVVARARVRVRGRVARAIVARNRLETEPRRTYRVRLRIPPAGLHRIKRALRRGARVRAKVTLRVSDAAGNVLTRRGRVRLRP